MLYYVYIYMSNFPDSVMFPIKEMSLIYLFSS